MTSRIVVGVDGSSAGADALAWAAAEAGRRGWGLHLVSAYSLPSFSASALDGGFAALDDSAIRAGAEQVVADCAALVAGQVPTTTEVQIGDAAAVLVDASRTAALAVVGTRGRGGFAERLLGTVSSALPAHAHCPTVVVPSRAARGLPADSPVGELRRVVVGVDGSPQSELALRHAIAEATLWGAELVTVAGVPVASMSGALAWLPGAIDTEQLLADYASSIDESLDVALAPHGGLRVRRIVLDGTGAELLTEFSVAADLTVVGSRGRGGFAGLLLGSTSQAVLHHAKSPVMVVTGRCAEPV